MQVGNMSEIHISEEVKSKIKEARLPSYNEIPDIGLFLEQITKYVSEYLEPFEGISITGSMISNYVKKKLIDNPIKKQYYREQIADVIFIALVKSVLSLEEAEHMLKLQRANYDCKTAYECFCSEFLKVLCFVFGVGDNLEEISEDDPAEKNLLRKAIVAVAYKIYLNEVFRCME